MGGGQYGERVHLANLVVNNISLNSDIPGTSLVLAHIGVKTVDLGKARVTGVVANARRDLRVLNPLESFGADVGFIVRIANHRRPDVLNDGLGKDGCFNGSGGVGSSSEARGALSACLIEVIGGTATNLDSGLVPFGHLQDTNTRKKGCGLHKLMDDLKLD